MIWKKPHISKIYEALGAIGDKRIEISDEKSEAKMYSSSRNKFYTITWNDDFSQMMSNDNSAYWVGQVSYPMIAVLMLHGKIAYDGSLPGILSGIPWKDINQKFKNNFDKTVEFVLEALNEKGVNVAFVQAETERILVDVHVLEIESLGPKMRPPAAY